MLDHRPFKENKMKRKTLKVFADVLHEDPTLEYKQELRRYVCIFLGFFVVLPLGLLRDMSSIGKIHNI